MSHDQVLCVHCEREIRPDGRGGWVHLDGAESCRDEAHAPLATSAQPPAKPAWPLNPTGYGR